MMNGLRLYGHYIRVSIRSQVQYRASFLLSTFGHFLITGCEFLGILVLFQRFGTLRGWTLAEIALFYGMANVSFAIAEAIPRGFDKMSSIVKMGDFDRFLLRPRSLALQLMGYEFQLRRIGRLSQALAVLIWALVSLHVVLTSEALCLLVIAILGGACLFSGLFILQATMSFWTVESLELFNTLTYGGMETAQYPLTIYKPWFRRFFTMIIPLACINYFPALVILRKTGASIFLGWGAPLICVAFLMLSLRIWQFGVRHYASTGS
jgi:ABC-2 type transport system permease protein